MKSPTVFWLEEALRGVQGAWEVSDDPYSYGFLITGPPGTTRASYINKMSGGWISLDPEIGEAAATAIKALLPFEHHAGRGRNHYRWRDANSPPKELS
jgi:hypothetical protein